MWNLEKIILVEMGGDDLSWVGFWTGESQAMGGD
jgi:hypothetical protein